VSSPAFEIADRDVASSTAWACRCTLRRRPPHALPNATARAWSSTSTCSATRATSSISRASRTRSALDEIKRHHYTTHDELNPKRIIPAGPLDLGFA
jgi:hypothetical protein